MHLNLTEPRRRNGQRSPMKFGKKTVASVGGFCLALGLALVLVPSLAAQEARWKELNTRVIELYQQGKYAEAIPVALEAVRIAEATYGAEDARLAVSLAYLGLTYDMGGNYGAAELALQRALAIYEKALGPDHPSVASSLNNLALLYKEQDKYAEAEPLYRRALVIHEKVLGPEHPETGSSLQNLAVLYYGWGRPADAQAYFDRGLQNLARQFDQQFAYMSEKERLGFLDTLSGNFPLYLSFCFKYREQDPALPGKMYDLLLWEKGLIASSVAGLRAKIAASGDKEALALLDRLAAKKTQLAGLY